MAGIGGGGGGIVCARAGVASAVTVNVATPRASALMHRVIASSFPTGGGPDPERNLLAWGMSTNERAALFILFGVAALELVPVVPPLFGIHFGFVGLGHALTRPAAPAGWLAAVAVAALYVAGALRSPEIRAHVRTGGILKAAGVALAVGSGLTEEVVFRQLVITALAGRGQPIVVQIVGSALIFGVAHAIWGLFGGRRTAVSAMLWTTALGAGLAIVFIAGGRSLLPCVVAHTAINLVLEPALVLSALGRRRPRGAAAAAR